MFDTFVNAMSHVLTGMFVVGIAGCIIVIPWSAIKMFSVLFEKDAAGEE